MYKRVFLITGISLLLLAGIASAAEMIGFVNTREVLFSSAAGKKAKEEMEKLKDKLTLQVKGSATDLQKLNEEMEKQKTVLSETALKSKQAELQDKYNKHQLLIKGADEELRSKEEEVVSPMLKEIQKIIDAIGEKEKYTAIFDTSAGNVLFKNSKHDLTKRVLDDFDKASKAKK